MRPPTHYQLEGWSAGLGLRPGDTFTVGGVFVPRTFWEWLTGKPRELKVFVVPYPENQ